MIAKISGWCQSAAGESPRRLSRRTLTILVRRTLQHDVALRGAACVLHLVAASADGGRSPPRPRSGMELTPTAGTYVVRLAMTVITENASEDNNINARGPASASPRRQAEEAAGA